MYEHQKIEQKWQEYWQEHQTFAASNNSKKPKSYLLVEFPYPSGAGLHVGHVRSYTALDTLARKRRMEGYNVYSQLDGMHLVPQPNNMPLKTIFILKMPLKLISKPSKNKSKNLVFPLIGIENSQPLTQNTINGPSGNS